MFPNFFASAHVDYASHGVSNLRSMLSLPTYLWPLFLQGQMFVVHQIQHGLTCSSNQSTPMAISSGMALAPVMISLVLQRCSRTSGGKLSHNIYIHQLTTRCCQWH